MNSAWGIPSTGYITAPPMVRNEHRMPSTHATHRHHHQQHSCCGVNGPSNRIGSTQRCSGAPTPTMPSTPPTNVGLCRGGHIARRFHRDSPRARQSPERAIHGRAGVNAENRLLQFSWHIDADFIEDSHCTETLTAPVACSPQTVVRISLPKPPLNP